MSTERIQQFHEQASTCYLNGDYSGALEAWRQVLGLNSKDEQALDGIRMASQFIDPDAVTEAHAPPEAEVEHELDRGLMILDGMGDQKAVPEAPSAPAPPPAAAAEENLEGWEAQPPETEEGVYGLEPVVQKTPGSALTTSAAAAELQRRVDDLLAEAKAKAAAGERDDALAILSRLAILDEDNSEAESLRASIEETAASNLDQVERLIIEGVAALEADRLDEAEKYFRDVLARAPDHREAKHYIEKVAQRRAAAGHEDLLKDFGGESAPMEDAVHRATSSVAVAPAPAPAAKSTTKTKPAPEPAPEADEEAPAKPRLKFKMPPQKTLIYAGAGAVVLVLAAILVPMLTSQKPAPTTLAPTPRPPGPHAPRAAKPGNPKPATPTPELPGTPEERAKAAAADLTQGTTLMNAGDFGAAVIAFNAALTMDPGNAAAKAGIAEAGERYKASKAERDALANIQFAFRDSEFTSALRLAYRLPPSVPKSRVDNIKLAGWYNLAVVALRAGECKEALGHLDEALQIAPSDAEAKKLKELASHYADAVKDRIFLDRVESLAFRPLPES